MPSIINQAGFPRTARPAIYARIDASALSGGALDSGALAIVGDFPSFPSAEPVSFSSRRAMAAYDSTDRDLAQLAALAFSPSDDANANRGAALVGMINAREGAAAASLTQGPLTLTSRIYGPRGNRLQSTLTISGDTHTLSLNRNGLTELFSVENEALLIITNNSGGSIEYELAEGTFSLLDASAATLLSVDSSEAPTLRALAGLIDQLDGISAELADPTNAPLAELDYMSATISDGASSELKAPAFRLKRELSSSALVSASLDNASTAATFSASTETATGGAQGSTLDYEAALASIEAQSFQLVVLFSLNAADQSKLSAHLDAAARAGYERQAYTAIDSTSALSAAKSRAVSLNAPDIALAAQSIEVFNPAGERVTLDARYTALMFAAMQAGSDTAEPLTRKRPRVISFSQAWDSHADAEAALRSGLIFMSRDNIGARIERGLTTWLEDNNPIYSEISAYESLLVSVRDIRQALSDQIGRPTRASQMTLIESRVNARLTAQVLDGTLKGFANVTLEDLGDQIAVSYDAAPVEPLNFITLTAVARRL